MVIAAYYLYPNQYNGTLEHSYAFMLDSSKTSKFPRNEKTFVKRITQHWGNPNNNCYPTSHAQARTTAYRLAAQFNWIQKSSLRDYGIV